MKTLQDIFKEYVPSLKSLYLDPDGSIKGKSAGNQKFFKKNFPECYKLIEDQYPGLYKEILYCLLKDLPEIPKCKNSNCNNKVPLRKFHCGFQHFCCVECQNEWQRVSEEFSKKISEATKYKHRKAVEEDTSKVGLFLKQFKWKSNNNYYYIKDYCKHGDISKYRKVLSNIVENDLDCSLCLECNKELYDNYNPSEKEIEDFQKFFKEEFFPKNHYAMNKDWWMMYYPKYLKIITVYFEKYFWPVEKYSCFRGMYYVFMENLREVPTCVHLGCTNKVRFSTKGSRSFNQFCDEHMVGYNASGVELELEEFIKSLEIPFERNVQGIIKGEFDFFFRNKNLAIEFNGTWFHCSKFKDKDYHKNKYLQAKEQGIQLISIWEDDWNNHKEIVKSLIKSKLGLSEFKIGARECQVKGDIDKDLVNKFLDENHLQGHTTRYSKAYGLFYKGELVSLITIGHSRFKKGELELLRFCSKKNYKISGGFTKLVSEFKKEYKGQDLISYANCDISNGNIYKVAGFEEVGYTDNWSWFDKGQKVNRFNKEFRELAKAKTEELFKCYTTGTLKFMLKNDNSNSN